MLKSLSEQRIQNAEVTEHLANTERRVANNECRSWAENGERRTQKRGQLANAEAGENGERRMQKRGQLANAEHRSGANGEHRREKYLSATVIRHRKLYPELKARNIFDHKRPMTKAEGSIIL